MKNGRVTQSDIARECGVSLKVVSTILSGRKSKHVRFSRQTKEKVLEAVKKLNYRPNRSAQNLLSNRHNAIGFLIDDLGQVPPRALKSIIKEAKEFKQLVIFEQISWESDHSAVFFEQDSVDGLIIFESADTDIFTRIQELSIPCLLVNTDPVDGLGRIVFDERHCIQLAAEFLKSKGRTRPGLLLYKKPHYSNRARIEALKSISAEMGFRKPVIVEHTDHYTLDAALINAFSANPAIDGLITDDSMLSLGLGVLEKLGQKPGETADTVAIDNFGGNPDTWTALYPRIRVNMEKLAKEILIRLNSAISGNSGEEILMPYELVIGPF